VSDGVFLITKGMLTKYTSCTNKEMWEAGKSYLQTEQDPGYGSPVMMKNEGSMPAEFIAIFTSAAADLPANGFAFTAAAGPPECSGAPDQPATVRVKDITRGLAYSGKGGFHVTDKGSVVIQRIALEPGYTTGWHHHPDASVVIQTKGKLVNYLDCQAKEEWTQGNAYLHVPSEAKHAHANLTRNEEAGQAELVLLFFNVPNEQPAGMVPISPAEPPSECPTMH
jgi:quercetin dioxygenase-like cupin family protein